MCFFFPLTSHTRWVFDHNEIAEKFPSVRRTQVASDFFFCETHNNNRKKINKKIINRAIWVRFNRCLMMYLSILLILFLVKCLFPTVNDFYSKKPFLCVLQFNSHLLTSWINRSHEGFIEINQMKWHKRWIKLNRARERSNQVKEYQMMFPKKDHLLESSSRVHLKSPPRFPFFILLCEHNYMLIINNNNQLFTYYNRWELKKEEKNSFVRFCFEFNPPYGSGVEKNQVFSCLKP